MPEISRFFGIVIGMFYRDHEPAHFHARYGDHEITVAIEDGTVTGVFPRRALAFGHGVAHTASGGAPARLEPGAGEATLAPHFAVGVEP